MLTVISFIFVLGVTVFIHELGHFLFAKKAGVYVYEFSIGMGPIIYKRKSKKDETNYCIRLLPIGGFVSMAGEDMETDKDIPSDKQMFNKPWGSRALIIVAGVLFNFLLAIVLLFIVGLSQGVPNNKPIIASIDNNYPIVNTNIQAGDEIISINGSKISSIDMLTLKLQTLGKDGGKFSVLHSDGTTENINVTPAKVEVDGVITYRYGFGLDTKLSHGIIPSIKYAFTKTYSLLGQMVYIVKYLFTGKISVKSLAGPVGIFNVVGETAKTGFINLIYLIAYLCINVGFINIIPLPAFDGGRLLFLIIEKIKGSRVNPTVENAVHSVGFILLMILMIFITYNDILRLF